MASDSWPPISPPLGSLPSGGGSGARWPTPGQPGPVRVAGLIEGPADAYMMAVAYRGATEVGRWNGPIDWFRETPASFTLERQRGRWQWSRKDVRSLRVKAPNREQGGASVARWATDLKANRVSLVVVDNPGEPDDDAGTEGSGVRGQGRGHGRTRPVHTASARGPDTQGEDTADIGLGEPVAGLGESGEGEGAGNGQGAVSGQGRGSSDIGTRTGSEYGSESPSWHDNPLSDIAEDGGRTPADHGKAGGSAAGQRGASGHVGGSGWLNLIDIPARLSGAAALVAIVLAADIAGITNRVFQKAVRGLARKAIRGDIRTEVVDTARKVAHNKQRQAAARRELNARSDQMSASELKHALANVDQSLELATYAAMQKHARMEAKRYRTILAQNQDKLSARTRQLATENLTAWRHIEELAGEQARRMKKAARPKLLGTGKSTKVVRNTPGTASGGRSLKRATGKWLRGTHKNAAPLPRQVADALRGRTFQSWDAMRREVWKTVAADKTLRGPFDARDLALMRAGNAPRVAKTQAVGKLQRYVLHHRMPIQHGGGVYDLDNIVVVTPRFHKEALDSSYHMGRRR